MTVPETRKDHITFGRVRRAQGGRRGRHWQRSAVDRLERLEERFQKLHQLKGRIMTQYTSQRAREATVGTNSGSVPPSLEGDPIIQTEVEIDWRELQGRLVIGTDGFGYSTRLITCMRVWGQCMVRRCLMGF